MRSLRALLVFPLVLLACEMPKPQEGQPHIDEAHAKQLVIRQYTQLFRSAYVRHEPSGEYERYPLLEPKDLNYAEYRGDAWLVQMNPPDGFFLRARVGPHGDWVELTGAGFNAW